MLTSTPGLPHFDYLAPASLAEASAFLAQHAADARPFMGGTDTLVRLRDGACQVRYLVDVKRLAALDGIRFEPDAGLTIGAAVNMNRIIAAPAVRTHYPVLAQAAGTVAGYPLRSRATVVGNICNASPAGDTIGACLVLDGWLSVHGVNGMRQAPLRTFFHGPGRTVLRPGDIATALHLPLPPAGYTATYQKVARNASGDLAIVGVTALGYPDSATPSGVRFRLALASVAPVPLVPAEAEEILARNPPGEATIAEAAQAAMAACRPIDDARSSARYRRLMVGSLTRRALTDVWHRLRERIGG